MTRQVLMTAPSHFLGADLLPGETPTLPDDVADRLVARGRAVEAEADPEPAPSPRNRGAAAVIAAPAADPADALPPEIEPEDGDA